MNEINDLFQQIISQITIVEVVIKGMIIGIVASAPMGPVGVLCIQRTLNKGRAYGFVTGTGAAMSDILYALLTGYGLSFLYDIINNQTALFWLQLVGATIMFFFGIHTFRANPVKNVRKVSRNKSSLVHNGVTGFFITLSNPTIIFLFLGLFTPLNFMLPDQPFLMQCIGYLSIFGGAILWWFLITLAVSKLRARFDDRGIQIINRIIGVIVMTASFIGGILICTGTWSLH